MASENERPHDKRDDYPSIPSVAGSAGRNAGPLCRALSPTIERTLVAAAERRGKDGKSSEAKGESVTTRKSGSNPVILELASGTGEHLKAFGACFSSVSWLGSERSPFSATSFSPQSLYDLCKSLPDNVLDPVRLDVLDDKDWDDLRNKYQNHDDDGTPKRGVVDGFVINNLFHCAPFPSTPHAVFRHAEDLIYEDGFVSVYGAFKSDDGGFASEADRKFHERFTSLHPSFGLRTIDSLRLIAQEYGWTIREKVGMESGNWLIVFERDSSRSLTRSS